MRLNSLGTTEASPSTETKSGSPGYVLYVWDKSSATKGFVGHFFSVMSDLCYESIYLRHMTSQTEITCQIGPLV